MSATYVEKILRNLITDARLRVSDDDRGTWCFTLVYDPGRDGWYPYKRCISRHIFVPVKERSGDFKPVITGDAQRELGINMIRLCRNLHVMTATRKGCMITLK